MRKARRVGPRDVLPSCDVFPDPIRDKQRAGIDAPSIDGALPPSSGSLRSGRAQAAPRGLQALAARKIM
jgi:hypothetical protein